KVGTPTVYGGATDLRRSVEVLDPADRPSLYEYDAIGGWMLRYGQPLGIEARGEDAPGEPTPTPPPPTESCTQPDPNDPAFCTTDDPRSSLATEPRDAQPASATDNTYRTSYTFPTTGQGATRTGPDGSLIQNAYTAGSEAAFGGGIEPAGLLASTMDGRGKF